jgi:hypothetical protein
LRFFSEKTARSNLQNFVCHVMPAVSDTLWRVAFFRSQNSWGPSGPRPRAPGAPHLKRLEAVYAPLPPPRPVKRTPSSSFPERPGLLRRLFQALWKRRQAKKWEPRVGLARGKQGAAKSKGNKRGQRKVLAFLMGRRRHCTKSNPNGATSTLKIENLRSRQVTH